VPTPASIVARARAALHRQLAKRYLRKTGIGPATRSFATRHGLEVTGGPFAGLRYVPRYVSWSVDLIPKLLGTYEQELHPVIERWLNAGFDTFVDVGSAEGYYAVGLARGVEGARVHAFDIQEYVNGVWPRSPRPTGSAIGSSSATGAHSTTWTRWPGIAPPSCSTARAARVSYCAPTWCRGWRAPSCSWSCTTTSRPACRTP
jgi:hypothetical protein